uniref:S-locus receptor kinase C-terminal domain-containing protein n=1 Tax=Lactuca sativa TaxID=4236 RepID=A0A9R1W1R5_LACSA|nr:hypothetical protein LSAT_V11C300118640 [Lactuca sativa]
MTVGLLCVQEDPGDRPTMVNVVLMLGIDIESFPDPKEPTFVVSRRRIRSLPPSAVGCHHCPPIRFFYVFFISFPFVIYSSFLYPLPSINSFLHRLSPSGLLTLEPLLVIDEWLRSSTQRPVPTLSSALKATGVGEGSPSKCSADRDLASGLFF